LFSNTNERCKYVISSSGVYVIWIIGETSGIIVITICLLAMSNLLNFTPMFMKCTYNCYSYIYIWPTILIVVKSEYANININYTNLKIVYKTIKL